MLCYLLHRPERLPAARALRRYRPAVHVPSVPRQLDGRHEPSCADVALSRPAAGVAQQVLRQVAANGETGAADVARDGRVLATAALQVRVES
jgi:hypothetical protein